jgi:ubiquinone/menaquinone biosynthesis C-methylase UbiE
MAKESRASSMKTVKENVTAVFDSLASTKAWESLYKRSMDRVSYNFVTRQRTVENLLEGHTGPNVIDLGCGTGDLVPFYASKGVRYTGLDLSNRMIERATCNFVGKGFSNQIRFIAGDCENLPFQGGEFDTLSAIALIEYLPDPNKALNEISRVLKPGGYALLTVPHKSCINYKVRNVLAPARRALFPLYLKLKGEDLSMMKDVKHFHYDPEELDDLMKKHGFEKCVGKFSNFYVIVHPFDHAVPKLYIKLSEIVDRSSMSNRLNFLAANYIALYKKIGSDKSASVVEQQKLPERRADRLEIVTPRIPPQENSINSGHSR